MNKIKRIFPYFFAFCIGLVLNQSKLLATSEFIPIASAYHGYVNENLIISLEMTNKKEFFIEVINLGNKQRCLDIEKMSIRNEKGKVLHWDLFLYDGKKSRTEGGRKACILQLTRRKWELGYSFEFPAKIRKVVVIQGSRAYRLQPLTEDEFKEFSKKLEKINIDLGDRLKIFQIRALFKNNFYGSYASCKRYEDTYSTDGTRGAITLLSTIPKQTEFALKKKKGGEIAMKIKLDQKGEVVEVNPENELEYGLAERAIYEVKNWWEFAPAIKNGVPVDSEHRVKIIYRIEDPEIDNAE